MGTQFETSGNIAFDIETRTSPYIGDPLWEQTSRWEVACIAAYDFGLRRYLIFSHNDVQAFLDLLDKCDLIVSWNGWLFDLPVLYKVDKADWEKSAAANRPGGKDGRPLKERSQDMLQIVYKELGLLPQARCKNDAKLYYGGWKIGQVAEFTLGTPKVEDGAKAPQLFKEGRWGELYTYCMDDVRMLLNLWEFAQRHCFLTNGERIVGLGRNQGRTPKIEMGTYIPDPPKKPYPSKL